VLTGFLLCGHLWTDWPGEPSSPWQRWTRRAEVLIPPGAESSQFSAAWIFAAAYPEAVILRHGHIRPVLIRDWSPDMDGIEATIWASQTTLLPARYEVRHPRQRPPATPASRHAQKYLHRKLCTIILAT
jgi:hypothetical protein